MAIGQCQPDILKTIMAICVTIDDRSQDLYTLEISVDIIDGLWPLEVLFSPVFCPKHGQSLELELILTFIIIIVFLFIFLLFLLIV